MTLWKIVRFRLLLWHAKGLPSTCAALRLFFFARSARRLSTHVNHGIKQPTCRCTEVKCLCVHILAGSSDTNSQDCVGWGHVPLRADVMLCVVRIVQDVRAFDRRE